MSETPEVKVVDRRWWAREEGQEAAAAAPSLKPTYVEDLERQLAERTKQLQEQAARVREIGAEFDEARTRLRREVLKDAERARRALLAEFLDVLDNLDRAVEAALGGAGADRIVECVDMVRRQFLSKLESLGVTPICALGEPFDPTRHDAVSIVPAADASQDGQVVGLVSRGFAIGDEVLRPARVAVARANQN